MNSYCLVLLLLITGYTSWAEPLYPVLSKSSFDSLLTQLRNSRPDTNRVNLLLRLSDDLIAQTEEVSPEMDKAHAYTLQAKELSEALHFPSGQVRSLYALGRCAAVYSSSKEGKVWLDQGLALSQQLGNKELEATGWYYSGYILERTESSLAIKMYCFQQARRLYAETKNILREAFLRKTIADLFLLEGNSKQAISELLQAIDLYRSVSYYKLHYSYDLLVAAHRAVGNYKEALQYGLASIASAKAARDTADIGVFYWRIGLLYKELKQYDEAIAFYKKSLLNAQKRYDYMNTAFLAGGIATIMIAQKRPQEALDFYLGIVNNYLRSAKVYAVEGNKMDMAIANNLANCYLALNQYAKAESQFAILVGLMQNAKDVDALNYMNTGKFYLITKRYAKAHHYYSKALATNVHKLALIDAIDAHLQLFKIDSAQAKLSEAIAHYQQYKALNDSIFNINRAKQIANLQIQYDTKKKEQNIILLTKQTQVQQAGMHQRELQRNGTLAGAALLALLLGVSYNRYRLKQHSNQLLEAKQAEVNHQNDALERAVSEKDELLVEKEWLLREIHHRVKNNLQVISSLLNSQSEYLRDPVAAAALRESHNRVQAMALLHQKLYKSESRTRVDMPGYIGEIVDNLLESFDRLDTVQGRFEIAAVEMDVTLATPLGLIVNEAVTNALKHAFPGNRRGTISIGLADLGRQVFLLTIADDGVGLPSNFDLAQSHSLGLTIIKGLSKQIDGELSFGEAGGVQLRLRFEGIRKAMPSQELQA